MNWNDSMSNNHILTKNIICPYCGYEEFDSWEYNDDEGEIECPYCEKKFYYKRSITIKYTTTSNCEDNDEDHEWNEWEYIEIDKNWRDEILEEVNDFYMRKCKKCDEQDFMELIKLQKM